MNVVCNYNEYFSDKLLFCNCMFSLTAIYQDIYCKYPEGEFPELELIKYFSIQVEYDV